jgi:uncharacterized membrane protein YgcG
MKNFLVGFLVMMSLQLWSQETISEENTFDFPNPERIFPAQNGLLVDQFGLFDSSEKLKLETKLSDYQTKSNHAIYVVIVDKIQPYTNLIDYTNDLSMFWQLDPNSPNHIILVMSLDIADIRINTTEQNVDKLSIEFLTNVLENTMVPAFNEGLMFEGVDRGLDRIMETW